MDHQYSCYNLYVKQFKSISQWSMSNSMLTSLNCGEMHCLSWELSKLPNWVWKVDLSDFAMWLHV